MFESLASCFAFRCSALLNVTLQRRQRIFWVELRVIESAVLEFKMNLPFEQFPALSAIGICRHVFIQRIPGVDVSHAKAEVLERLDAAHREIRNATGFGDWPLFTAEQIHGNNIAVIDSCSRGLVGREFPA
jgi:hypothetical protein